HQVGGVGPAAVWEAQVPPAQAFLPVSDHGQLAHAVLLEVDVSFPGKRHRVLPQASVGAVVAIAPLAPFHIGGAVNSDLDPVGILRGNSPASELNTGAVVLASGRFQRIDIELP